jgi:hypothetical protein
VKDSADGYGDAFSMLGGANRNAPFKIVALAVGAFN